MSKIVNKSLNRKHGFSLVELLVSLSVGLVMFAGVMSVFVGMRATTSETSSYGELQENGRFALSVISDDLLRQNFWGDYAGSFNRDNLLSAPPAAFDDDCVGGGVNNSTFPQATGPFRTLWGTSVDAIDDDPLGCFPDDADFQQMEDSDVIQLKRAVFFDNGIQGDTYYLTTNSTTGTIQKGAQNGTIDNARTWEYQHHVYYVRESLLGNNTVPVLMQGTLGDESMDFSPIIDGIEKLRFMYGVDSDDDGVVNAYISEDQMTQAMWNNAGNMRILAVKVFILVRSILPDLKYENENTYQLGDIAFTPSDEGVDNYRRLLFSSTVTLYNNTVRAW